MSSRTLGHSQTESLTRFVIFHAGQLAEWNEDATRNIQVRPVPFPADLSFINRDRLPGRERPREPIPELAPDLAVEVLSVGNTRAEMSLKVREYFEAGVVLVWLIDPRKRLAHVYTTVGNPVLVDADESLDGGEILPGFGVVLSELFDEGRRPRSA